MASLDDATYAQLLNLRTMIRRFQHWSETQAHEAGITPMQHQLLLAIRGHSGDQPPTATDVAESLVLKHHSVVELIDRAEQRGLISRTISSKDRRRTTLQLTKEGRRVLEKISKANLPEIAALANISKLSKILRFEETI